MVNVASKCGFTPQYEGLEELYKTYRDREPGTGAHPLHRELTAYPTGEVKHIGWNFEKFLVCGRPDLGAAQHRIRGSGCCPGAKLPIIVPTV